MKNIAKRRLLLLGLLILPSISTISACGTSDVGESLRTLFIPKADLSITNITSTDIDKGVSILQTFTRSGNILNTQYKFNNPIITIANKVGLPRVIFKQMIVQFTVGNTKIPAQRLPIAITVPSGAIFTGTVPILSSSDDLINSVFPNNSFPTVQSSTAEITLLGVDDNNNLSTLNFSTPIRFESNPENFENPNASPVSTATPSNPTSSSSPRLGT